MIRTLLLAFALASLTGPGLFESRAQTVGQCEQTCNNNRDACISGIKGNPASAANEPAIKGCVSANDQCIGGCLANDKAKK